MKIKEFEKQIKELNHMDLIRIHYRSNWRGGDGRPYDHRKGKEIVGSFNRVFHKCIDIEGRKYDISYRAIKSITKIKGFKK